MEAGQQPEDLIRNELIRLGRAQEALDALLDGPLGMFATSYPSEPATLRATLDKYGVPIPTIGVCKIEIEPPNLFSLPLPQPTEGLLPSHLSDILNRSTIMSMKKTRGE